MTIFSVDPGPLESAYVILCDDMVESWGKARNDTILRELQDTRYDIPIRSDALVIEQIRSYGMAVGAEVFDTCVWSGRFCQAWMDVHLTDAGGRPVYWLPRKDVKLNLCGNPRAKDSNIRQAIIDRFGGKETAIGRKATPGPLYGISADVWSALAVGLTWLDLRKAGRI